MLLKLFLDQLGAQLSIIIIIIWLIKDKVHEGSFLALWNLKILLDEKMLLVIIFVTYDSQQFQLRIGKNLIASLREFFNVPMSSKKTKNSKNRHFSPIFGDKLVNWNMKSKTRHKDILARQSENSPLSTGDNEKLSFLGLHSWFYKFITKNGAKVKNVSSFEGFATIWGNIKPS